MRLSVEEEYHAAYSLYHSKRNFDVEKGQK